MGLKEGVLEIPDSEDEHELLSSSPLLSAVPDVELGVPSQAYQDEGQACADGVSSTRQEERESLVAEQKGVLDQMPGDGETDTQAANEDSQQQAGEDKGPTLTQDLMGSAPVQVEQLSGGDAMRGNANDNTIETANAEAEETLHQEDEPSCLILSAFQATAAPASATKSDEGEASEYRAVQDNVEHQTTTSSPVTSDAQMVDSACAQDDHHAAGPTDEQKSIAKMEALCSADPAESVPESHLALTTSDIQLQEKPTTAQPLSEPSQEHPEVMASVPSTEPPPSSGNTLATEQSEFNSLRTDQECRMEDHRQNSGPETNADSEASEKEPESRMLADDRIDVAESKSDPQASGTSERESEPPTPVMEPPASADPKKDRIADGSVKAGLKPVHTSLDSDPQSFPLHTTVTAHSAVLPSTAQTMSRDHMPGAAIVPSTMEKQAVMPEAPQGSPVPTISSKCPQPNSTVTKTSQDTVQTHDTEMDIDPPQPNAEPAVQDSTSQTSQEPKGEQENPITRPAAPAKGSQEAIIAELKAKRVCLLDALGALSHVQDMVAEDLEAASNISEISEFHEPTDAEIMKVANRIVQKHIKFLHEYNEMKDVGQGLMGLIADQRGVRIVEIQDEFGIGDKD